MHNIASSSVYDPVTGFAIIDDNSLPDWLLKRYKKDGNIVNPQTKELIEWKAGDVCRTPDGKPYLSLKTMISLNQGAIRQVDDKVIILENKVKELEKEVELLKAA